MGLPTVNPGDLIKAADINKISSAVKQLKTSLSNQDSTTVTDNGPDRRSAVAWLAALAAQDVNNARVMVFGDSITEGWLATTPYHKHRAQAIMRNLLSHYRDGEGYIPFMYTNNAPSTPWTTSEKVGTNISFSDQHGAAFRVMHLKNSAWVEYQFYGDRFTLHYWVDPYGMNGYVSIDGGPGTAFSCNNPTPGARTWDSGPLTKGTHTVRVSTPNFDLNVILEGATFYNGDYDKGVTVFDAGHFGWMAGSWVAADARWVDRVREFNPHLVMLCFGTNDLGVYNAATFQTNLTSMVDRIEGELTDPNTHSIAIVAPWEPKNGSVTYKDTWANYIAAMKTVAAARPNVFYVDTAPDWPVLTTDGSNNRGLMFESPNPIHPSPRGQYLLGKIWAERIGMGTP